MEIVSSSLSLASAHSASQTLQVTQTMQVAQGLHTSVGTAPQSDQVSISSAGSAASASDLPANLQIAKLLVERLTGMKIRTISIQDLQPQQAPPAPSGGVAYTRTTSYSESEQTSFSASGVARTSDGRDVQFNLAVTMARQYSVTTSTSLTLGGAAKKTDPLVINYSGAAPTLTSQRFSFDLNSDGSSASIPFPTSGSGFLVLAQNGTPTNGSQLFGPTTGNGFKELAAYDANGNGWIDGGDPVYSQLKVWSKDAVGNDQLASLQSLGIGAISLTSTGTPFDIKTTGNQLLGTVRQSGVYLTDQGGAGTVSQIDLAT